MSRFGTLLWLSVALAGITCRGARVLAAESAASACVEALEQVATLKTQAPVYRLGADRTPQYIADADRPAEIARQQRIIAANCSTEHAIRQSREAAAEHLHAQRSPECTFERDKLAFMENPSSRDAPDTVATQRKRVAEKCALSEPTQVWLVQKVWIRP